METSCYRQVDRDKFDTDKLMETSCYRQVDGDKLLQTS